jgi:hypothetical protein
MTSVNQTGERLEQMGIAAWGNLEHAITSGGSLDVAHSTAGVVFVADGVAQLRSVEADRSPDVMGASWPGAAAGFILRGVRAGRLSRDMAHSKLLDPALREIQILEWLQTREEVFEQNPGYHGSRFGAEYAQAIASGRVTYDPAISTYINITEVLAAL